MDKSRPFHPTNGAPSPAETDEHTNEAVCFTAGLEGAPFGAGVIHAYLATARKAPRVVAGISMGALTSAAFHRAYKELKGSSEDARWQWYRRYLKAISEKPLDVIWSGIPNQSDFFAEFNPVEDPVPGKIADPEFREDMIKAELDARRDLTLFVKLGHWLSRLPIKVGTLGDIAVKFVRFKEKYGYSRFRSYVALRASQLKVLVLAILHNALNPQFIDETRFGRKNAWPGITLLVAALVLILPLLLLVPALAYAASGKKAIFFEMAGIAISVAALVFLWWSKRDRRPLLGWPLYGACMSLCLLVFIPVVSALAWLINASGSRLANSVHHPVATAIGKFFSHINLSLKGAVREAFTVLFLVVFLATVGLLIKVISAKSKTQPVPKLRPVKPLAHRPRWLSWLFNPIFWKWSGLSLAILIAGICIAGFFLKPVASWLAAIVAMRWFQALLHGLEVLGIGLMSVIDTVSDYRLPITAAAMLLLLLFFLRIGQDLTTCERYSLASANRRRYWTLCGFSLRVKFPTKLMVVLALLIAANDAYLFFLSGLARWQRILVVVVSLVFLTPLVETILREKIAAWSLRADKWMDFLANAVFENLNLRKSLVHNYYLRLALYDLFREDRPENKPDGQLCHEQNDGQMKLERDREPILCDKPFPAILVAAPLQVTPSAEHDLDSYQVWAADGSSLIDALTAALAVPGVYQPAHLKQTIEADKAGLTKNTSRRSEAFRKKKGLDAWRLPAQTNGSIKELHIVDGTVIRQNPIPAFFNFVAQAPKAADGRSLAECLSTAKDKARVHVVYSVPIDPAEPDKKDVNASVVDVGLAAAKLSRRRDTQLEVHQSNLLSQVEKQLRNLGTQSSRINPIFVDEIAPKSDAGYKNPLSPTRDEVLDRVAAGCRSALEVIYAKELAHLADARHAQFIPCSDLMNKVSDRKAAQSQVPGLPEICAACDKCCARLLKSPPRKPDGKPDLRPVNTWASLLGDATDCATLPQLSGKEPRIAFVASGGVFRGTFHVGMVAALLAARIKPDLIVGASVGTIMGGALASAFSAQTYEDAINHLEMFTSVLLSVDHQIAFTKPFKNAVRDLGIRARDITISPNDVRKMVLDGSRDDAAFGVVGAPSALIDNISHLLLIPHKKTASIAAEFIAGHVTLATKRLLDQLKKETLKRLDIEFAVIGTSLLQPVAQKLLTADGANLKTVQPFKKREIAIYGTTIDYWRQRPVLLGADRPNRGPLYNFIEAALCSSAFPCVFPARRESDLYPGTGEPTTLFSDGGMFDNLPFLPAAEILSKVQVSENQ